MAAEASLTSLVGTLLNGTYRLERVIAEGGMGVVYEASHVRLPRRFAVKVLGKPQAMTAEVALARFRREAEIASSLGNEHIVEVFDYQVSEGGSPYLVMERLEGEDLQERLRRLGRMSFPGAIRIITEIAEALDVAHAGGVVHRDLKPANVFLMRRGNRDDFVKVLDFGVSKLIDAATLTTEKAMVGTPLYMSPEQAVGTQDLTPESDVFSLGAIAFEMLSGRRAFAASSIPSILYQIVHGATPTLAGRVPGVGPEIDAVFNKVLAKKKENRFPGASVFAAELAAALQRPTTLSGGWQAPELRETPIVGVDAPSVVEASHGSRDDMTEVDASTKAQEVIDAVSSPHKIPIGSGSASMPSISVLIPRNQVPARIWIAAAIGALVVLTGAFMASRNRPPPAVIAASALPVPAPVVTAPPAREEEPVVEEPAPEPEVQFSFRVNPRNAEITVDDTHVNGTTLTLPWQKKQRRVRVTAPGYRTLTMSAPSMASRSFELHMEKLPQKPREIVRAKPRPRNTPPVQDL